MRRLAAAFAAALLAPLAPAAPDALPSGSAATVYYDVEYARALGEPLRLDVAVPLGAAPAPRPVVVIVHGGGWSGGDKAMDITGLFAPLTEAGFVWVSVNYRLAPAHRWPAQLDDVRAALRWTRANAAALSADPERIAVLGYSAGAQLAALAAMTGDDTAGIRAVVGIAPALDLVEDSRRRGQVNPSLQALLDLPAPLDEPALDRLRAISPAEHVRPGLPPFLLLQGDADKTVLAAHTASFAEKLRSAGVACEVVTLPGAQHRLSEWERYQLDYRAVIPAWLKHTLASPSAP